MPAETTLITGGKIVDGTGNPWFYGDVALTGKRISAVTLPGQFPKEGIKEVVDAAGMVVCPGFIDIQSHSITPLMVDGRSLSKITQGVTTEIMGEGWTPAPFGGRIPAPIMLKFAPVDPSWEDRVRTWSHFRDWLEAMIDHGVSPNIGSFLGGWTLRQYAKGMEMGQPTADELDVMRRVIAGAMEEGAFGVARALIYPPDAYTELRELVEVSKVVSQYEGIYITHIRSEADEIFPALEETFEIGRQADLPVEIYHLKASGRRNWSKLPEVIERIDQARAEDLDVTADMYPYTAAGTTLASVLPPWSAAGKFFANLRDPVTRARIRKEALQPTGGWEAMVDLCGPEGVMPLDFRNPESKCYSGKTLSEIAEMRGQVWVDAVMDLCLAEEAYMSEDASFLIGSVYFIMGEENVRLKLQQPWIKISTDAGGYDPAWGGEWAPVHPRSYGTYPRVLGKYVREEGVLTLEDAVRKMSSSVANRLGIRDRGILREGMAADVVIFDPRTIADRATFKEPHQLSAGVRNVWVNGTRVLKEGTHTGATPGEIVSGPGNR